MTLSPLYRRTLLQGGATIGCLAIAGLPTTPGLAAPATATTAMATTVTDRVPLAGPLVGWVVIQPDGGGRIDLVELDAESRPARQVATEALMPATSLAAAARQARVTAIRTVAASWQVPEGDCACEWGRIGHAASGRTIPFAIWTDFA
jgi:hypothetical protein